MLEHPVEAAEIGAQARARVRLLFTRERMCAALDDVYSRLLGLEPDAPAAAPRDPPRCRPGRPPSIPGGRRVIRPGRLSQSWQSLLEGQRRPIAANLLARVGAIGSLLLASLVVARIAGPAGVGTLVLLRVLPWLTGLVLSCGLYGAAPYFLSGPGRSEPRYRSTLAAITVAAGVVGAVLWIAASPLLGPWLFPQLPVVLVAVAGVSVLTQALESSAMACCQGFDDLSGANRIIFLEEFLFLPFFGLLLLAGTDHFAAIVLALLLGDLASGGYGWTRLARLGFFTGAGRPSVALAGHVAAYGFRAQLGSIALLLNARLDFALVGAMVGPASLGIYAVASRYAELLRLPSLAMNYVLYPDYARDGGAVAADKAGRCCPRSAGSRPPWPSPWPWPRPWSCRCSTARPSRRRCCRPACC